MEILEMLRRARRDARFDRLFVHSLEFRVAYQTAGKKVYMRREIKAPQRFYELLARFRVADPVAVCDLVAFEQAAVAGQHDPALSGGNRGHLCIGESILIKRVEAQKSKIGRKAAKVDIEHKARLTFESRAERGNRTEVDGVEGRVDADEIAGLQGVRKIDRLRVDHDEFDFRMRHADALNRVLHRRADIKSMGEQSPAPRGRQKIVQFTIEAYKGAAAAERELEFELLFRNCSSALL